MVDKVTEKGIGFCGESGSMPPGFAIQTIGVYENPRSSITIPFQGFEKSVGRGSIEIAH